MESSEEAQKKRKGRNDLDNRDYICPCGKSYLSYPALFVHVKQKHDGKPPGELIKPKNENVKRGRPKINPSRKPSVQQKSSNGEQNQTNLVMKMKPILEIKQGTPNLMLPNQESGKQTCLQILNLLKEQASFQLNQNGLMHLNCFLQFIRRSINNYFGENYSQSNNASQIIDCANFLATQNYQQLKQMHSFSQIEIIQLTKIFFEWLYHKHLTNHIITDNTQGTISSTSINKNQ